jgi:hypothetical protein
METLELYLTVESASDMIDHRFTLKEHADNIEAKLRCRNVCFARVTRGGPDEMAPFFLIDCFFRQPEVSRCPRLYFHDYEAWTIPSYEVELARSVLGLPVPGNDDVAKFLEKAMREILAASAPGVRAVIVPQPRLVAEPIAQNPERPHLP